MIVLATTSAENAFQAATCVLQGLRGVSGIPAFDVAAVCAGFIYALSIADQFVKSGAARHVLVVGPTCSPAYAIHKIAVPSLFSMMVLA